ncbi:MAG: transposase [Planctomycetes bacterium]|nr:transposase [Planctomycetota bacterium]
MKLNHFSWPHAPTHRLSEAGTYFVTASTYQKQDLFRTPHRLDVLHRGVLRVALEFEWHLEAWAVFSNHYHFVAHAPPNAKDAASLARMLGKLHTKTAAWINRLDATPGRKVWHNYFETKLTYHRSYLARVNYVHHNPVRHGLVAVAKAYPWCSARWIEAIASRAQCEVLRKFDERRVVLPDDYAPTVDW